MTRPAPGRRRVGGDVYLDRYPPGSRFALRLDVGFEVPGWKARVEGRLHRASFPGTAIAFEGAWYEVVRVETPSGQPRRVAYDLAPFDESAVIRTSFELTAEACDELTRRHREREARSRHAALLALLPFFTGLLPGTDQARLESAYGVSADRATLISAVVLLLPSVMVLSVAAAFVAGMPFGEHRELVGRAASFSPLALYLAIESWFRLRMVGRSGPVGSLLLVLPLAVLRGLREMATAGRPDAERPEDRRGILAARDRVTPFPGRDDRLVILSRLPKEHWTANVTGIEYEGETWVLTDRRLVDTPAGRRHRFVLEKPEHEVLWRSCVRYRPEEVRDVYKERQKVKSAMWVETFAVLWGLLDGPTQRRLARLYRYDPEKQIRRTVFWSALAGAFLLLRGAALMVGGLAGAGDAAGFFFGLLLTWESAVRWSKIRDGQLAGSLLGVALRPLARSFLQWE